MLKKLFIRPKANPSVPEPAPPKDEPAPNVEPLPDPFGQSWESGWEKSHEVVEGDGGHTDWALWTTAVEVEKNAFAPTVPRGDSALSPLDGSDEDTSHLPTVPMGLGRV